MQMSYAVLIRRVASRQARSGGVGPRYGRRVDRHAPAASMFSLSALKRAWLHLPAPGLPGRARLWPVRGRGDGPGRARSVSTRTATSTTFSGALSPGAASTASTLGSSSRVSCAASVASWNRCSYRKATSCSIPLPSVPAGALVCLAQLSQQIRRQGRIEAEVTVSHVNYPKTNANHCCGEVPYSLGIGTRHQLLHWEVDPALKDSQWLELRAHLWRQATQRQFHAGVQGLLTVVRIPVIAHTVMSSHTSAGHFAPAAPGHGDAGPLPRPDR